MAADTVLVTLDGSPFSEAALPYAQAMAKGIGGRLRLLTVLENEIGHLHLRHGALGAQLAAASSERAHQYHDRIATALRETGFAVETTILEGSPAAVILEQSARDDVAVIALATHGRGGLGRWVLGSVADKVMRLAPCPTLLMRPSEAVRAGGGIEFRQILVPLDGSSLAETALAHAVELSRATKAELRLARAVPILAATMDWGSGYVPELDEIEAEMAAEARSSLEAVRARIPDGITTRLVILHGEPAAALENYAKRETIDLTIMATHGRGGVSRLATGSVAERLVQAGVPVLLVHGPAVGTDRTASGAAIVESGEPARRD